MTHKLKLLTFAVISATTLIANAGAPGPYSPVTDERLKNPEPKKLADVPWELRGVGLQPARQNQ